jgi:hypothetical protein
LLLLVAVLGSTSGLAQWGGHSTGQQANGGSVEPTPLDSDIVERLLAAYGDGRYADFDRLAEPLAASVINPFEFEADGERWIDAGADGRRRAFVAAAVALELARVPLRRTGAIVLERNAIDARFVLAELGCAWLREHPASPAERSWHAAFVALARATSREGYVIPVVSWEARVAPLTGLHEKEIRSLVESAKRKDRERETHLSQAHREILTQLRRKATRLSGKTRIDVSGWRFEHGRHLLARFPDDPHLRFLEGTVWENYRAMYEETLLDGWFNPVWLDAPEVERIAKSGREQVRSIPRNRRMDRPSAERLLQLLPQEWTGAGANGTNGAFTLLGHRAAGAAFVSLTLWQAVNAFRAVPPRAPVAAETALRLGQNYVRLARPDLALPEFLRAEALATTPYEQYLARLFAGAAFARTGRRAEALTAFRGALHAVPRASSASFALARLLLEQEKWEEAVLILEAATATPQPDDPLDYYYWSDPAATSRALAQLREEARQ